LTAGCACVGIGASVLAAADSAWAAWRDLLNFKPDSAALSAARAARGRPPLEFEVQRIERASKPTVNLDNFAVRIDSLPSQFATNASLLAYVRKNINNFFDPAVAQLSSHLPEDNTEWQRDGAPLLGTIMLFNIKKWGLPAERGAVIVSKATDTSWIFSPIRIGRIIVGSHPVAGNREFGIRSEGGAQLLYVRAADRPYDLTPPESVVFEGADALWSSFQARTVKFINEHAGKATVVPPVKYRVPWQDVVAAGYFTG
jgi:hypothetical protein